MKQTVTIEIIDSTVLQLLKNLADMSLVRFTTEITPVNYLSTANINEIYKDQDSSLDQCYELAQTETFNGEDW